MCCSAAEQTADTHDALSLKNTLLEKIMQLEKYLPFMFTVCINERIISPKTASGCSHIIEVISGITHHLFTRNTMK